MTDRTRAWAILAVAFLAQFFSIGVTLFSFGLYVAPLEQAFDISRTTLNGGMLIMMVGMSLFSAVIGRFLDRLEIRYLMALGATLLALGMLGIANSTSLLAIALYVAVPISIGVSLLGPLCAATLINNWFDDSYHRGIRLGTAMGLVTISTSFGGILLAPLTAQLMIASDWRHALTVEAGLLWVIMLPLSLIFVRSKPSTSVNFTSPKMPIQPPLSTSTAKSATSTKVVSDSAANILRSTNFWPMVFGIGILFAINQAFMVSLVPYAQGLGIDAAEAAQIVSLVALLGIAGKLLFGWLAGHVFKAHLMMLTAIVTAVFFAINANISLNLMTLSLTCAVFGFFTAGLFPVWTSLLGDCYNKASYGTVMGLMQLFMLPMNLAMVFFVGKTYDLTGNYSFAFAVFTAVIVLSIFAIFRIKPQPSANENNAV